MLVGFVCCGSRVDEETEPAPVVEAERPKTAKSSKEVAKAENKEAAAMRALPVRQCSCLISMSLIRSARGAKKSDQKASDEASDPSQANTARFQPTDDTLQSVSPLKPSRSRLAPDSMSLTYQREGELQKTLTLPLLNPPNPPQPSSPNPPEQSPPSPTLPLPTQHPQTRLLPRAPQQLAMVPTVAKRR